MNAVLREITNTSGSRERLVVKSSVIPSAKYSWPGSLLRLTKGSTTIERRGATKGWPVAVVAATARVAAGEDLVVGQNHQVTIAITSTPASATPIGARMLRR